MITQTQMAELLGRPLTTIEADNYDLYLENATQTLDNLLCMNTSTDVIDRVYKSRIGYSDVRIDPFSSITSVKINGNETTGYIPKRGDDYQSSWYDTLEFEGRFNSEQTIEVRATWGFGADLPTDLAMLLSRLFTLAGVKADRGTIKSKKIEDVSITYDNGVSMLDAIKNEYAGVIAKYSQCGTYVLNGSRGYYA